MEAAWSNQINDLQNRLYDYTQRLTDITAGQDILVREQREVHYCSSVDTIHALHALVNATTKFRNHVEAETGRAISAQAGVTRRTVGEKLKALQSTRNCIDAAFDKPCGYNDFSDLHEKITKTTASVGEMSRLIESRVQAHQEIVDQRQQSVEKMQTKLCRLQREKSGVKNASEGAERGARALDDVVDASIQVAYYYFPPAIIASGILALGSGMSSATQWCLDIHGNSLVSRCKKLSADITQAESETTKAEAQLKRTTDLKKNISQLSIDSNSLYYKSNKIFESSRTADTLSSIDKDWSTLNILADSDFSIISELIDTEGDTQQLVDSVRDFSLRFHQAATAVQEWSAISASKRQTTRPLLEKLERAISSLSSRI